MLLIDAVGSLDAQHLVLHTNDWLLHQHDVAMLIFVIFTGTADNLWKESEEKFWFSHSLFCRIWFVRMY